MKTIRHIAAAVVFFVLSPLSLFAQTRTSSEFGLFIVGSSLKNTDVIDQGDHIRLDFDGKTDYGLSLNRYWNEQFSTELAYQKIKADLILSSDASPIEINAGQLSATSLTGMGQWHFLRGSRFSPYVGAGIARISGKFKFNSAVLEPGDSTRTDLESKTTWTASAGANIRLTDRMAIGTELKYIPWSANEKGGAIEDAMDVDPLTLAVGLKFSF